MKMMQKMGIDPNTVEGLTALLKLGCVAVIRGHEGCDYPGRRDCDECTAEYLLSEVPMKKVKRWETYEGDFINAEKVFNSFCLPNTDCCVCRFYDIGNNMSSCFAYWLMEEVEVEL